MKPITLPKQPAPDPAYLLPWAGTLAVFAMYVLVNIWLYERVMQLIQHVANPFFVMLLVAVTVCGQLMTIWQTWRFLGEARSLDLLTRRLRSSENQDRKTRLVNLDDSLNSIPAGQDVRALFQNLLRKDGEALVHDPARLQHQADNFAQRRCQQ